MKKLIIIVMVFVFCASCVNLTTPIANPAAAAAFASAATVAQVAMPIIIAGCVGILIVKRKKDFVECDEPIMPDMVDVCAKLKESERVRGENVH